MRLEDSLNAKQIERFWSKVQKGPECWIWTGALNDRGYGFFLRHERAHRISWCLTHGPIPNGLHVLHRCDNPRCVNPSHLFLGTHIENVRDMVRKGRAAKREGHSQAKLTSEDVIKIREAGANGKSGREIAKQFGISHQHVSVILRRKQWIGVEP